MQEFTAPINGNYKLEVWGAQGEGSGGKGGYTCGYKSLNVSNNLYVCVGGRCQYPILPYNGGGVAWKNSTEYCRGGGYGGGASHIATTNRGELKNYVNNQSEVLLVAGGGGGFDGGKPGVGGGESGTQGSYADSQGTSSSGGKSAILGGNGPTIVVVDGSFGQGGYAIGTWNNIADNGGTGGGGWYGGGGSATAGSGGGGSGHINTTLITNGVTIAGDQTFPSPSGGTETGHAGTGHAIITWRQLPQ